MEQPNRQIHLGNDILKYFDHQYDINSSDIEDNHGNHKSYDIYIKEKIFKNGFLSTLNDDNEQQTNDDQCQLNQKKRENQNNLSNADQEISDEEKPNKEEELFFHSFHHMTENLVKYQLIPKKKEHNFQENDFQTNYLRDYFNRINDKKNIRFEKQDSQKIQFYFCSYFNENKRTGDKFLKLECINEINGGTSQKFCIVSADIWKFDFKNGNFQKKKSILLDILQGVDPQYVLTRKLFQINEKQYFYMKNNDNGKNIFEIYELQLNQMSEYEFLNENQNQQKISLLQVKYEQILNIELPKSLDYDLSHLEYCFLTNSNQVIISNKQINHYNLLKQQYVMIRTIRNADIQKKALLIYSLKNTKQPLVMFVDGEFDDINIGFFTIKDQNNVVFTLKSKFSVYEITCNHNKGILKRDSDQFYNIHKDDRIQIYTDLVDKINEQMEFNYSSIIPQQQQIKLKNQFKEEQFLQSYYIDNNGDVNLIYPFHFKDKKQDQSIFTNEEQAMNQRQETIKEQIKQSNGLKNQNQNKGVIFFTFNNQFQIRFISKNLHSYLISFLNNKNVKFQKIICSKDLIVCYTEKGEIHVYSLQNTCFKKNFFESSKLICRQNNFLNRVTQQFNWKYQHEQQMKDEIFYHQNYYMNKFKSNFFTLQNEAYIKDKKYIFEKNYLLIDLSELYDEKERKISNPLKLLKLYNDKSFDCLHLMKYYATNKGFIFFFKLLNKKFEIQSKKLVQFIDENQGLEFIVLKTLNQLNQIVQKDEALLESNSVIYVPSSISNFRKEYYQQQMLSKKFLGEQENILSHKFTFESVVDHLSPCPNWIPFIYHQKVAIEKQDLYFCFLNLENIFKNVQHYEQSQEIEDLTDFSEHMQVFFIDFFQGSNEPYKFKECSNNQVYRNQNYSAKVGAATMFTRCSDWQHNMFQSEGDQHSTRYQIAFNFTFDEIQQVEIQEFLVTIDKKISFINEDQNNVFARNKDKFKKEINSYIALVPIQQRFLYKSQLYIYNQKAQNQKYLEKEKLIPIINDNGKIEGSLFMLNQISNYIGVFQISNDIELLEKLCNKREILVLKKYLGQYIYVDKKSDHSFQGYFSDGTFKMQVKYQFTEEFQVFQKLYPTQNESYICKLMKDQSNSLYFYNIIELRDKENIKENILAPIKGPFCRQAIKRLSFGNQMNNQIFICSTAFNKQTIYYHCFDKDESIYLLYYFNKYLICMSLPNFNEFLFLDNQKKIQKYFQPRYIFQGKSFIHNDFKVNALNILNLKRAFFLNVDSNNNHSFIENSVIYFCLKSESINQNSIIKCLQLSFYYGLQYDYLKYESIIQNTLDNRNLKALSFIITYLLDHNKDKGLCNILNQDLPQLLSSTKVNINEYLNICYNEEMMIDEMDLMASEIKQQIVFNNFEQFLINEELPIFGNDESKIKNIHKFDGPFESQNQILQIIINDQQKSSLNQNIKDMDSWSFKQTTKESNVQLQFSFIDFTQIIKKIKIDKILERPSDEQNGTKYLDLIQEKPQNINQVDDLLISTIINHGANINPSIIEQSTIKRIIELQYQRIKPLIGLQLKIYLFCFVIPFAYNLFYLGSNHDEKKVLNYWIVHMNYTLAMCTQIAFLVLELADIKYNGFRSYFSNGWNLFDASQFIVFSIHLSVRVNCNKISLHGFNKLGDCMLQILIIMQSSVKILQYIRYQDEFSFLVQMITQVFIDLIPFFSIFLMYIFVFSMITIIMEADFVEDGYEDLPRFIRILLQTFRNSIGDIQTNKYGGWQNLQGHNDQSRQIAIVMIWIFWVLNVFGMVVIMINFLISQVGHTYQTVKDQGSLFLYRQKAQLNQNVYQIENMFGVKEKYKAMIFQQPKKEFQILNFDNQYQDLVEHIKEGNQKIFKINDEMTTFLNLQTEMINDQLQQIQKQISELQEQQDKSSAIQSQDQFKSLENLIIQQEKERQIDRQLIAKLINKVDQLKMQQNDFKKLKIIKKEQKNVQTEVKQEKQITQQNLRRQSMPEISQQHLDISRNSDFNITSQPNFNAQKQKIQIQIPAIIPQKTEKSRQQQLQPSQVSNQQIKSNQESVHIFSSQISESQFGNIKKRKSPFNYSQDKQSVNFNKKLFETSPKSVFQQNHENLQKGIQNILNDQKVKNYQSRSPEKEKLLNVQQISKNKLFINQKMKNKSDSKSKKKDGNLNYENNFLKNKLVDFDDIKKIQKVELREQSIGRNQKIFNKSMIDTKQKINLLPEQIDNITKMINMNQKREPSINRISNARSQIQVQSLLQNFTKMQGQNQTGFYNIHQTIADNVDLVSVDDQKNKNIQSQKSDGQVKKVQFYNQEKLKIKKFNNKKQD